MSLLAPLPASPPSPLPSGSAPPIIAKVPLRLESGPEGAMVAVDARSRQVLALVGSYEGVTRWPRPGHPVETPARVDLRLHRLLLLRHPLPPLHARHTGRRHGRGVSSEGATSPSNYEGWTGTDPLRLREVLANSVNVGAVRVLAGRRTRRGRRVGSGAGDPVAHEAQTSRSRWAATRSSRSSSAGPTRPSPRAACTRSRSSSAASWVPTARTPRSRPRSRRTAC